MFNITVPCRIYEWTKLTGVDVYFCEWYQEACRDILNELNIDGICKGGEPWGCRMMQVVAKTNWSGAYVGAECKL